MGCDVELDEISFRSRTVGDRVVWIRYLAIARRGSSKIWLTQLPYRITEGGQGGGGPISLEKLKSAILLEDGDSRICQGSVFATQMGRELTNSSETWTVLCWTGKSLMSSFSDLHLAHTAVKHKPPRQSLQDISDQGVDWLCLGSGKETRWDIEVRWLFFWC